MAISTDKKELPEGWVCPSCKKVLSPKINMCGKCSKDLKEQETSSIQFLQE